MTESILVTGATGTVGRHVVSALSDREVITRIGVRGPETVSNELADAGIAVVFDFTKPILLTELGMRWSSHVDFSTSVACN